MKAPVETAKAPSLIKVKSAFLHQSITWPGISGTEKSITQIKIPGIKMSLIPQGLLLEHKGSRCLVPYANVANCILEDETEARA